MSKITSPGDGRGRSSKPRPASPSMAMPVESAGSAPLELQRRLVAQRLEGMRRDLRHRRLRRGPRERRRASAAQPSRSRTTCSRRDAGDLHEVVVGAPARRRRPRGTRTARSARPDTARSPPAQRWPPRTARARGGSTPRSRRSAARAARRRRGARACAPASRPGRRRCRRCRSRAAARTSASRRARASRRAPRSATAPSFDVPVDLEQEVGAPAPPAVDERRLRDHLGAGAHRLARCGAAAASKSQRSSIAISTTSRPSARRRSRKSRSCCLALVPQELAPLVGHVRLRALAARDLARERREVPALDVVVQVGRREDEVPGCGSHGSGVSPRGRVARRESCLGASPYPTAQPSRGLAG